MIVKSCLVTGASEGGGKTEAGGRLGVKLEERSEDIFVPRIVSFILGM